MLLLKRTKTTKLTPPEQGFLENNIKEYIKKSNKNNPQTGFLHD